MNIFERTISYLSTIGIADIVDIIIVAFLIYELINLIKKTNSSNLAKGLIIIVLMLWISAVCNLTMVNYFLKKAVELGLVALVILFQPEIRRALEKIGSRFSNRRKRNDGRLGDAIEQTVIAANNMSRAKTGALIVYERDIKLTECISSGTVINSDVNAELIKNIFFNKAPLHDGAIVIRDGKIVAAGCILPLTKSTNLSKDLGMRHRAGIGLSEQSDAVIIIVSEETGAISVAIDGMLKRHLRQTTLDKLLRTELLSSADVSSKHGMLSFIDSLFDENIESEEEQDE